jgi:hypothetical protein
VPELRDSFLKRARAARRRVRGGGGHPDPIGEEFLGFFTALAGLSPDDRVLDVGSGKGLTALPLTRYLSGLGSYEGFDARPREDAG